MTTAKSRAPNTQLDTSEAIFPPTWITSEAAFYSNKIRYWGRGAHPFSTRTRTNFCHPRTSTSLTSLHKIVARDNREIPYTRPLPPTEVQLRRWKAGIRVGKEVLLS